MLRPPLRASAYRLARLLAVVGQLALLLVAGGEGTHGPSAVSHIERGGVSQHYAHNEATCVACTVLSLHARGETADAGLSLPSGLSEDAPGRASVVLLPRAEAPNNPSRAPPILG